MFTGLVKEEVKGVTKAPGGCCWTTENQGWKARVIAGHSGSNESEGLLLLDGCRGILNYSWVHGGGEAKKSRTGHGKRINGRGQGS